MTLAVDIRFVWLLSIAVAAKRATTGQGRATRLLALAPRESARLAGNLGGLMMPYNVESARKRGRAVECTGLENRQWGNPFVSSNLTASATGIQGWGYSFSLPFLSM